MKIVGLRPKVWHSNFHGLMPQRIGLSNDYRLGTALIIAFSPVGGLAGR